MGLVETVRESVIGKDTAVETPFGLRRVTYAWHTPAFFADGDAELDILAHTLGDNGTGGLLGQRLGFQQFAHDQESSLLQKQQQHHGGRRE